MVGHRTKVPLEDHNLCLSDRLSWTYTSSSCGSDALQRADLHNVLNSIMFKIFSDCWYKAQGSKRHLNLHCKVEKKDSVKLESDFGC